MQEGNSKNPKQILNSENEGYISATHFQNLGEVP
jgi:hypothetical protein